MCLMCYVIDAELGSNVAWSKVGGIGYEMNHFYG